MAEQEADVLDELWTKTTPDIDTCIEIHAD